MKINAKTIINKNIEAERKNIEEKISFLSHISHNIRTPLNSIIGFSKLLELQNLIDPKQKEYVQGILRGSNLLLQHVENIIYLSQIEVHSLTLNVKKYLINKILWEFVEEFNCGRIRYDDFVLNLRPVWESGENNSHIEIDLFFFKEILKRMINIFSLSCLVQELELGYRKTEDSKLDIFIRPVKSKMLPKELFDEYLFRNVNEKKSFDYFNLEVLIGFIDLFKGTLILNSKNQEISFIIPTTKNN